MTSGIGISHKYKFSLLRNFGVEGLKKYLKTQIPNFTRLFNEQAGSKSHVKICNLLNEQVKNGFDDSSIEGVFFQLLMYVIPERSYYLTLKTDLSIDAAIQQLHSKYPNIVDRKLTEFSSDVQGLVSIRREQSKLIFLFNEGTAHLGLEEEPCYFFVSCIVDFVNQCVEVKLNEYLRRSVSKKVKNILNKVEKFVANNLTFSTGTESFYLELERNGEAVIHKGLYKLFTEESSRSLNLIKGKIAQLEGEQDVELTEKELKQNVAKYLEEQLHLRTPEPYVNKVLSAKYQDTAQNMEESEFINDGGFIFGFTFVDRRITKSTNKNEQNKPVYYSKIYWDLKETVNDYAEICELGVYWKFNKVDFSNKVSKTLKQEDLSFVEVGFKEIHNVLEIHYYFNKDDGKDFLNSLRERRFKEKYVINKIKSII